MKRTFLPLLFCLVIAAGSLTGCDKLFNKNADPGETEARGHRDKALRVARNYENAWNRRDASAVAALYAENASLYMPGASKPVEGRAAIEKEFENLFQAFPDLQTENLSSAADGNKLLVEGKMTGTNSGPMKHEKGETPATNQKIDMRYVMVAILDDSLISEDRTYYNAQEMEKQLYPNGKPSAKGSLAVKKKKKK